jgi:chorismate mutase
MVPPENTAREKRLTALRGAARCRNDDADITAQTVALYDELLTKNSLGEADLVSVLFSITPDIDALNPAAALRKTGRAGNTALFVLQEAVVKGGLERTIRVLIYCYMDVSIPPVHVYRNGAEILRPDRAGRG